MAACRERDLGTGLNTVDRDYSKPADQVWSAAVDSVKQAGMRIETDRHDALGGELVARRPDNSEVRINVKSLDQNNTKVSVRVGSGDKDLANNLQERIAEKMGMGEAKGGLFGGNSPDATYNADLESCVGAARRTYEALKLTVTHEETHESWAQIDARQSESNPVRIKCEKTDDGKKTKVTFIAGNEKNDDNKSFVQRMKDEFERNLGQQGAND
jgi:hypothetical protein